MRGGIILIAALALMSTTSVRAAEWCGYAAHEKSVIECGYSTAAECESAIGKGGMCFIDPNFTLNSRRATPAIAAKAPVGRG